MRVFEPFFNLGIQSNGISMEDITTEEMQSIGSSSHPQQEASRESSSAKEPKTSRLKMLAKMVKETVVVMRNVQVVNLQSIISAQQKWRIISEGYQNLLEFGTVSFFLWNLLFCLCNVSRRIHVVVSCGAVSRNEHIRLSCRELR